MTNATFSFAFNFTSREQYLTERAAWKANYKALSSAQRTAKMALKQAFRDQDFRAVNQFMGEVVYNKDMARTLLETLVSAKEEAHRQYLAAHTDKQAA